MNDARLTQNTQNNQVYELGGVFKTLHGETDLLYNDPIVPMRLQRALSGIWMESLPYVLRGCLLIFNVLVVNHFPSI